VKKRYEILGGLTRLTGFPLEYAAGLPKVELEGFTVAKVECHRGLLQYSDTLVELGGVPLGKPIDREDAIRMLRALSGSVHYVHTGVCVHYRGKTFAETDTTAVHFRTLSEEEILAYVESGEPMDKAGAYGIQGKAGVFVSKIEGAFDTVVGLSSRLVEKLLSEAEAEI
jgi:septum formation protein